jgi:hypothetical protein
MSTIRGLRGSENIRGIRAPSTDPQRAADRQKISA